MDGPEAIRLRIPLVSCLEPKVSEAGRPAEPCLGLLGGHGCALGGGFLGEPGRAGRSEPEN